MTVAKSLNISPKRQDANPWRVLAKNHPAGTTLARHHHETGQLVFAVSGVMLIETGRSRWTVPPQRALWVPPRQPHEIQMLSNTEMRTVYFAPPLIEQSVSIVQLSGVHVVTASPLIRQLVLGLFDEQRCHDMRGLMVQLLLYALREAKCLPTDLPMPVDVKLRDALVTLIAANDWSLPLNEVAARVAMSERVFTRRFTADVGINFRAWRQRARIIASLDLLASNRSTKVIAHRLGYANPAAYVSAFRDLLECTPSMFRQTSE
jgi:AraC-like DNA-binding protein